MTRVANAPCRLDDVATFRQSRYRGAELFRPVTLRPRLSTGLPFRFVTANLVFSGRNHYEIHHIESGINAKMPRDIRGV
jgi:hypothetical protein